MSYKNIFLQFFASVRGRVGRKAVVMYDNEDDYCITGHQIGDDGQLSHVKISNRFGSKVLTLDRWIELCWPDGHDYPVPPEEMERLIDREIGGAN
jgi:hypothetical protein